MALGSIPISAPVKKTRDTGFVGSKFVGNSASAPGQIKKASGIKGAASGIAKAAPTILDKIGAVGAANKPTMPMKNPISSLVNRPTAPVMAPPLQVPPMAQGSIPPPMASQLPARMPPMMSPSIMGGPPPSAQLPEEMTRNRNANLDLPVGIGMGGQGQGGLGAYMQNKMQQDKMRQMQQGMQGLNPSPDIQQLRQF